MRIRWVDILKALAITLIVWGHVLTGLGDFHSDIKKLIFFIHVPTFFMASGFFAYRSLRRKGLTKYILDTIKFLGIPYLFFSAIFIIIRSSPIGQLANNGHYPLSKLLFQFVSPNGWNYLWFLFVLMSIQIIFGVVFTIFKRMDPIILSVIGIVLLIIWSGNSVISEIWTLKNFWAITEIPQNMLYFLIGVLVFEGKDKIKLPEKVIGSKTIFVALVVASTLFLVSFYHSSISLIIILSGMLMLVLLSILIDKVVTSEALVNKIQFIGKNSLIIYLLHQYVVQGCRVVFVKLFPFLKDAHVILILLLLVLGIAIPLITYHLLEKITPIRPFVETVFGKRRATVKQ
jgi:fucose 4-O-acetylase-like acetyltransferase